MLSFLQGAPTVPIIEINNLVKEYPKPDNKSENFRAVDNISLAINSGEIYGILGPNGAGKTTTLEMLEGLTDIDGGDAFIDGIAVKDNPFEVKKIIGVQLQANEYFDNLSLVELINLFGALYGRQIDALGLLGRVNLTEKAQAKPANLSGGQKQRFSIACALVNDPKVLFLDEPTTGLDPQAKRNLWDLVTELNSTGMTIVLTTHNMEEAESLCQRIAIMDHGKLIAEDTPQKLILEHAPEPPEAPLHGSLEDVFLVLTGHGLRD
jgi:ABC-2 type transport system ATP-binding protein